MCGIVGYVGPDQALPVILEGLRRLEYRGYDSAGVALVDGDLAVVKREGKLSELDAVLERDGSPTRSLGTRWGAGRLVAAVMAADAAFLVFAFFFGFLGMNVYSGLTSSSTMRRRMV